MDELDQKILQLLQYDFPLEERPFEILASRLGMDVEAFRRRVQSLLDQGVIRRLGASFDSRRLGFCSTLAAVSGEADAVDRADKVIGRYPEVTHSYLRDHEFNIWFTIIARDAQRLKTILGEIRADLSLQEAQILNLPMKRVFKLDARFTAR